MTVRAMRSIVVALAVGLSCGSAYAQSQPARASSIIGVPDPSYRGSNDVIAKASARSITERDLFLFQMVSGRDALVAKDWKNAAESRDTVRLARIRLELQNMMRAQMLAAKSGPQADTSMGATKAARLLAGEVAKVVWMDEDLARSVVVHDEDIAYEYRTNWKDYSLPDTMRVRRARVPLGKNPTAIQLEDARRKAEELRTQAVAGGGLEPILAADPGLAADPSGHLQVIERGDPRIDSQLQESLFALRVSQLSEPLESDGAIYIYEVVSREDARVPPLDEVSGEIANELAVKMIPTVFKYRFAKAVKKSRPVDRSKMFRFLPEDVEIMRVRDFEFTKEEFTTSFPRIAGPTTPYNAKLIGGLIRRFLVSEIVTQEAEKSGALGSSSYSRALELADVYIAAEQVRAERSAETDPTEDEVKAALEAHRAEIEPKGPRLVWKLALEPRRSKGLSETEKETSRALASAMLAEYVQLAKQQLDERRQIAGDLILESPEPVIENMPPPRDESLRIDFDKEGSLEPADALEDIGIDLLLYDPGEFTSIEEREDGGAVCYYIGAVLPPPKVTDDELLAAARKWLVEGAADHEMNARIAEMEASGAITYSFPVNAATQ